MIRKLIILIFITFNFFLFAQNTWIQSYQPFQEYNVDFYYEVADILVALDGGFVISGEVEGWTYDPPSYPHYIGDWGFLMKTDCEGNLLWATRDTVNFTGFVESNAIVETDDGGIWVASQTLGTLTKFNSNGEIVLNFPNYDYEIFSMDRTNDGNIVIAGYSIGTPVLRKINQEAEEIWSQTYEIENYIYYGKINSVRTSADGGYLLTGFIMSEETNKDILVIKTDATGDTLWTRTYDGNNYIDEGLSIVEDGEGNIMCAGITSNAGTNGFLWYLTDLGETIWIEDNNEDIVGYGQPTVTYSDLNFISLTYDLDHNTIIYSFNEVYDILWENTYQGDIPRGDKSVHPIDTGFIFSNYFSSSVNLIKTDATGQVTSVNNEELIINNFLSNYPNPFNPTTSIEFSIQNKSNVELSIFNIKGQKIKTLFNNKLTKGSHSIVWNGDDDNGKLVSSGVYFYKLNVNGKTEATKRCLLLK